MVTKGMKEARKSSGHQESRTVIQPESKREINNQPCYFWRRSKLEDLIKQNKGESRYSTRSMVLIKSARVTDRIRTCAISNSDSKSSDLIKQNKGESQYSTRSMVLIKSARVTDRIRTCAISNSDPKSNVLDHSAIGTPLSFLEENFLTFLRQNSDLIFKKIQTNPLMAPSVEAFFGRSVGEPGADLLHYCRDFWKKRRRRRRTRRETRVLRWVESNERQRGAAGNLLKYIEIYESAIYYNNTAWARLLPFCGPNQKQNNRVGPNDRPPHGLGRRCRGYYLARNVIGEITSYNLFRNDMELFHFYAHVDTGLLEKRSQRRAARRAAS
ncbi:hypothetical protein J6590_027170 [Homalodisca vitripennis]|nr:hypothetical protein J6590_027170 [Homalodisca vitripennis]